MPPTIIFDFDGTLIDSADAILAGLRATLAMAGVEPRLAIGPELIGPPLRTTLQRICGSDDAAQLDTLVRGFTHWYDSEGYRQTRVYPGIPELLQHLHGQGQRLHIVTNKRLNPTLLILEWLGWRPLFDHIETQDARPQAPLGHKTQVLARLLEELGGARRDCVYVGDRRDDLDAARANGLYCVLVNWGYGAADDLPADVPRADSPAELARMLCP